MIVNFYRANHYLVDGKLNHEALIKFFELKIDEEIWRKILLKTMDECLNEILESRKNFVADSFASSCDDYVVDLQFCVMFKSYKNCPKKSMKNSSIECKKALNFVGNCWDEKNAINDYLKLSTRRS